MAGSVWRVRTYSEVAAVTSEVTAVTARDGEERGRSVGARVSAFLLDDASA